VEPDLGAACANCGRSGGTLFPQGKNGSVCATCYESLARRRPEWSRLEVLGVAGLLLGSALITLGIIALLVR
jgi:hypothetical protein